MQEFLDYEPNDMTVRVSELLVATSDESDNSIDRAVPEVLQLLRDKMRMDIVFVPELSDDKLAIKYLDTSENSPVRIGDSTPLEKSWCQQVISGRLPGYVPDTRANELSAQLLKRTPFPIGTFLSTPIVLKNGEIYGTLCCMSYAPVESPDLRDLNRLKYTAQMTANMIDRKAERN